MSSSAGRQLSVGFDIGGTKTLGLVIASGDGGQIITQTKVPRPQSGDAAVQHVCDLVDAFETELGDRIHNIGVGIAGAIGDGWVKFSPNIPEIVDFPLQDRLVAALDRPVVVDNDANTALWAEAQLGAAANVQHCCYVSLGTGIGTAFLLDGRLYAGANGFAGEAGHMVVNHDGEIHHTGARGPWEMKASGTGLGALARSLAREGKIPLTAGLAGSVDNLRGEHVLAALSNEAAATEAHAILDTFADDVAVGMLNLIYVLDPERIVLGGGLVTLGEPLRQRIAAAVNTDMLGNTFRPHVPVILAEFGPEAGALGAALLASGTAS